MTTTLSVRDETSMVSAESTEFLLDVPSARISVRELIRTRVEHEVEEYNARQPEFFTALVQPTDAEQTLNGYRMPIRRIQDAEAQIGRALEAFERNGFLVLVDDHQIEDLDHEFDVRPNTTATFFKLVPLVGG